MVKYEACGYHILPQTIFQDENVPGQELQRQNSPKTLIQIMSKYAIRQRRNRTEHNNGYCQGNMEL